MTEENQIKKFKDVSLNRLKERVKEIRQELVKEKRHIITYSRNFTLSLTNYCQNQCGYCFYNFRIPKLSGEGNVILLENDVMREIIRNGIKHDCKEALLMSGERPDTFEEVKKELEARSCHGFIEFVKDICTYVLDFNILPHTNIGILSYQELKELKPFNASMGLMLESTNLELFKKGGVHEFSPTKRPAIRIKHLEDAGKLKIPFTTGLLLGIGESLEDRVKDLLLIRKIHEQFGHIQEIILQNFEYKEGIPYVPQKQITIEEMLKTVGIAKILFHNEVAIQVPPNLITGHEKAFLEMGVNDFGGISPFTPDYINPEAPWPNLLDIKKTCERYGYVLKERLAIYDKFISKKEFCPETIKKRIDNIT